MGKANNNPLSHHQPSTMVALAWASHKAFVLSSEPMQLAVSEVAVASEVNTEAHKAVLMLEPVNSLVLVKTAAHQCPT